MHITLQRDHSPSRLLHFLRELWLFGQAGVQLAKRTMAPRPAKTGTRVANPAGMRSTGGPPVLVLPGFLADDDTMAAMRRHLRKAGYQPHALGMGRNFGASSDTLAQLDRRVCDILSDGGERITLVGWSLGGLIAREYAKTAPHRVAAVVTLGSPFAGDIRETFIGRFYRLLTPNRREADVAAELLSEKPPVPTVAIWSPCDGVMPVDAARGRASQADRNIEVSCAHMAYPSDPAAHAAAVTAVQWCMERDTNGAARLRPTPASSQSRPSLAGL